MAVRRVLALLAGVLVATGLAACSGNEPATSGPGGASTKPAGRTVTVSDAQGTVALKAPAKRVVALEWVYAEDLLAVNVTPVGIADKAGYSKYVGGGARLAPQIRDVGSREMPNINAIQALRPDLIVTDMSRGASNISQLRSVAPVLVFNPYRSDMSAWDEMRTTFLQLSTAVDRSAQAAKVLNRLDATVRVGKQKLSDSGKGDMAFALVQGFSEQGMPVIRIFGSTSLAGETIEQLGLKNDWKGRPDQYGFSTVNVEDLGSVSMADFLYLAAPRDNIFTGTLANNAAWKDLEFVRTSRVHALGQGTWFYGGPLSTMRCVNEVVRALA
ncbi:ABC transporter substrate-binding protein [Actinopolymorpha alba]|uniref:ABC transporter substrate-binding protein n=1 Tax=Actinopolymorpha alba TaxID=533267 RepID=UPI00047596A2|nr:iron-siderophore ABC transporter substrate-binding protein [Actinopolymorpha alba]